MKHLLLSILALGFTAVLLAAGIGSYLAAERYKAPGERSHSVTLEIPRGTGFSGVERRLETAGVIANMWDRMIFEAAVRVKGVAAHLKAGEYEIAPQASLAEIVEQLNAGVVVQRSVTIREGLTTHEILQILDTKDDLGGEAAEAAYPQGSLLPETYHYERGMSRKALLERMAASMQEVKATLWPAALPEGYPLKTWEEVVTLASIVEKETGVGVERARVAGVFVNRLKKGMPLQSDPTVIFAITDGKPETNGMGPLGRRMTRKDWEFDSPYNTYKYAGLPPAPIAHPGRAAIEAVLKPEEHGYIYFVADGSGGHVFAKTLAEHNRNVAQWRKVRP